MSEKQKKNLEETVFTMHAEGFNLTEEEKQTLSDILIGKYSYKEVCEQYLIGAIANV